MPDIIPITHLAIEARLSIRDAISDECDMLYTERVRRDEGLWREEDGDKEQYDADKVTMNMMAEALRSTFYVIEGGDPT